MRLLLVLALAGCGSSSPPATTAAPIDAGAPPRAAACDAVAARLIAFQGDRMFSQLAADVRATWSPRVEAVFARVLPRGWLARRRRHLRDRGQRRPDHRRLR